MIAKRLFIFAAIFALAYFVSGQLITTDPACANQQCDTGENCRCASTETPGGLSSGEIPQIVLLSFDDAITLPLYNDFYMNGLFDDSKLNPNGCPIRATFFLQHDYTNYSLVHEFWRRGFEIASHSMTHRVPAEEWAEFTLEEITNEMVGLRTAAEIFARIEGSTIKGVRVPFLQFCGSTYTEMMQINGFTWDASRPTRTQMDPGLWPYTYDFVYPEDAFLDCPIKPCPGDDGSTFPGIWQIPINDLNDTMGVECAMLDQCSNRPVDYEEAMDLLRKNFASHYDGTRAPFNVFTHVSWFVDPEWVHNFNALNDWLDEILDYGDVYVMPVGKIIDYMLEPVSLEDIDFSPIFACDDPIPDRDCPIVTDCRYCDNSAAAEGRAPSEIIMPVCGRCPPCFPNPLDPTGNNCIGDPALEDCTRY